MKVIFLDFNGVLDTYDDMDIINYDNLKRLKNIVEHTGAKVVISSSLKNSFYYTGHFSEHLTQIIKELEKEGIEVIDITPNGENREEEIKMYLELHPEVCNFCIIDDDYDMLCFSNNLVKLTNQMNKGQGLDDIHMNMAIDILNEKYKKLCK